MRASNGDDAAERRIGRIALPATIEAASRSSVGERVREVASAVETWVPLRSARPSFRLQDVSGPMSGRYERFAGARMRTPRYVASPIADEMPLLRGARAARDLRMRRRSPATARPAETRVRVRASSDLDHAPTNAGVATRERIDFEREDRAERCRPAIGAPTPHACDTTRLYCNSSSRSRGIDVWASLPKPGVHAVNAGIAFGDRLYDRRFRAIDTRLRADSSKIGNSRRRARIARKVRRARSSPARNARPCPSSRLHRQSENHAPTRTRSHLRTRHRHAARRR